MPQNNDILPNCVQYAKAMGEVEEKWRKKMDLIDRSKLHSLYEFASDIVYNAPTVDAIPVKWIVDWLTRQHVPATHTCDDYHAVEMMLDDWEKENE